jgi:F-type H+-transporting ATPase subunit b
MAEQTTSSTVEQPAGGEHAPHATYLGFDAYGWVALSMLFVFVIFLWQKVPAAIGKALDGKISAIREQLAEAESLRREAEALKAEYSAKAAEAEKDAAALLERAKHEALALVEKAKADADALIRRRQKMAEDKIVAEQNSAVQQLRAAAAEAAARAAALLIAENIDDNADAALVDRAIAGLRR